MAHTRFAAAPLLILAVAGLPAFGQSVVSTHSGVVYFFEGSVFAGGQQLQQKFGKFPDLGEGGELRTEKGRAEVLLTPGVILRVDQNSAIRMISTQLADTRVELTQGSVIVEAGETQPGTAATLSYKNWSVAVAANGVFRIDSDPARVWVYKGEAQVATAGRTETVTVRDDELLPLADVLVAERAFAVSGDAFKNWAMGRSQAVSADNAISAQILDDPAQYNSADLALGGGDAYGAYGGFSYFPMTGIPSLGITNPYGLSFWSPYQAALMGSYLPPYLYLYSGWPSGMIVSPLRTGYGINALRPGLGGLRQPLIPSTVGTRLGGVNTGGMAAPYGIGARPGISSPVITPMRIGVGTGVRGGGGISHGAGVGHAGAGRR